MYRLAEKNYSILLKIICILLFVITASSYSTARNDNIYNICDYGAVGDGYYLNTTAIHAAVNECSETGGIVYFPAGKYLTGTIFMKSNVTLHLSKGAVLLGSTNLHDYPDKIPQIRSYTDNYATQSLIYAENLYNIAITGQGVINGQGEFFQVPKGMSGANADIYKNRPFIIRFIKCKKVLIENVTMLNSAMWMQHYLACDHLMVRGITVYNHCNRNNDMIDIDGCSNVTISDCFADTDDDAITLKSTSENISENIVITNCVVSTHCNAVKLGTESNGGFKNITISNIVVKPSKDDESLYGQRQGTGGIALKMVDGGILDGVTISNIIIKGPRAPLFLRLGNRARPYKEGMGYIPVGKFRNVNISNIIASGADDLGCSITGLPDCLIENVSLSNIRIAFTGGGTKEDAGKEIQENAKEYPRAPMFGKLPAYGLYIRHAKGISLNNIDFSFEGTDFRPALICDDVKGLDITGFRAKGTMESESLIKLKNTDDVFIHSCRPLNDIGLFLSVQGTNSKNINLSGNFLSSAQKIYRTDYEAGADAVKLNGNIK